MKRFFAKFRSSERGAVTVDWVVIVAGVVSLGVAVMTLIETEATSLATTTAEQISKRAD
jgi:Flp pilus assembly pilin Flp